MRILLVDDDLNDALLVRKILASQDPTITIVDAETCEQALDLAKRENFDCIVMDQKLMGLSGSECVRRLRDQKYVGGFVLLTGFSDVETAVEAIRNGADEFISKNDIREKLLPAIRSAVELHREPMRAARDAEEKIVRIDEKTEGIEDARQRMERRPRVDHDEALLKALDTIGEMAPNLKQTIGDIATLKAQMANIESTSNTSIKMLLDLQKYAETQRNLRWKMVIGFLVTLVMQAAGVLAVIFKR